MAVNLVQSAFRIRGDVNTAQGGSAKWFAAQNVVGVPTQQHKFRIRFQIENTGSTGAATQLWQLYCSRNGGAYAAVTTSGTYVQSTDATAGQSTDNSAITSALLTGGVTTFANGQYDTTGATATQALGAGIFTEFEFGIVFTTSLVAADTYYFRVYYNNTPLDSYLQTPTLLPTKNLPDLVPLSVTYNVGTGQFSAVILNQGAGDTPLGATVGCSFLVDAVQRSWSYTSPDPTIIPAGTTAPVDSTGKGGPYTIPAGDHTIAAATNDTNRFVEETTTNNTLTVPYPSLLGPVNRMTAWNY